MFRLFGTRQHPAGPSFAGAREHKIVLSGTHLRFSCPRSSSDLVKPEAYAIEFNLYDDSIFEYDPEVPQAVPYAPIFEAGWAYFGWPLFDGRIGSLFFRGAVKSYSEGHNLFSKVGFERAIDYDINHTWGPKSSIGRDGRYCNCPLNWQIKEYAGVNWIRYDVQTIAWGGVVAFAVTPLTDQHYLSFSFKKIENRKNSWALPSGLAPAYERMIENILKSIELDFSPDAQRAMAEAERMWPDQKYSESRQAFEWPEYKNRPKSEAEKYYDDMIKYSAKKPL